MSRALALLGVFTGNVALISISAEDAGSRPQGTLTTLLDAANSALLLGKARALLSLLFGVGVVFLWHSAKRQGQSPQLFLLRRFVVLFVVFGIAHYILFPGDILTEFASSGVLLTALLPWLLGGGRWRPLLLTGFCTVSSGFTVALGMADWPFQIPNAFTSTLAACAFGVWLARQPELAGEGSTRRLSVRMAVLGLTATTLGMAVVGFLPEYVAAQVPSAPRPVWALIAESVTAALMLLGGAACYFGVAWWLLEGQGLLGRTLHRLAPLGRLTLSAYLASTLIFLAVSRALEGQLPLAIEYVFAVTLYLAFAVGARQYLMRFAYGPAEWVWRRLTYGCALPMRRSSIVQNNPGQVDPARAR